MEKAKDDEDPDSGLSPGICSPVCGLEQCSVMIRWWQSVSDYDLCGNVRNLVCRYREHCNLNRDLKTKQSYMLWMVPHSTYEILASKIIAGILQMAFVFMAFFIAGAATLTITAASDGSLGEFLRAVREFFERGVNIQVDWGLVFGMCLLCLIAWMNVMVVGFLAVILTRTVLLNTKFGGVIAVILFFVINFVIDRIYIILGQLFDLAPISGWGGIGLFDYVFYIVMTVLVYLLVGWIADRKLSI